MTDITRIAVDPGTHGGIAWGSNRESARCERMPQTRRDLIDTLAEIVSGNPQRCVAYLEKVAPFIPDAGASQMFEFGVQAERPGAIIETLNVRLIEVTPQTWQKALNLGNSERQRVPQAPRMPSPPRGSSPGAKREWKRQHAPTHRILVEAFKKEHAEEIKSIKTGNGRATREWKQKLKGEAQRRFPRIANTLDTADALLVLEYAFQQLT